MGYNQLGTVHTLAKQMLSGIHQEAQDQDRVQNNNIKMEKMYK